MTRILTSILAATFVATGACGEAGENTADGATANSSGAAPVPSGGAATSMRVVLTGGTRPGTYEFQQQDPSCTVGYAREGAWGNAANDETVTEGLAGIDLVVRDTAAARNGTDDFRATVYFDNRIDEGNQYVIHKERDSGSGTVKIDDRGDEATVTIQGTTAEGVGVDARIECHKIMRG